MSLDDDSVLGWFAASPRQRMQHRVFKGTTRLLPEVAHGLGLPCPPGDKFCFYFGFVEHRH